MRSALERPPTRVKIQPDRQMTLPVSIVIATVIATLRVK